MKRFKRVLASFLVIVLLSFSVGSEYMDANSVYATGAELGMGVVAGDAILEALAAFLASVGLGSAAYSNRSELAKAYKQHLQTVSSVEMPNQALTLYKATSFVVENCSWSDIPDSLENFYDTAVDDLTDLYAYYCPALLEDMGDFVKDIVNGDVYVQGLSEAIVSMDGTFSDYESIRNPDGTYQMVASAFYDDYGTYAVDCSFRNYIPFVVYDDGAYLFYGYDEGTFSAVSLKLSCTFTDLRGSCLVESLYGFSKSVTLSSYKLISFASGCPVFASVSAALAAFAADDFSSAINYSKVLGLDQEIIANNDLPFWDLETQALLDRVSAPDVIWGPWSLYGEYVDEQGLASDLPFVGLGELDDFANSVPDVIDQVMEQWLAGERDLAPDIPFVDTYGDLWDAAIDRSWADVIDDSYPGVRDPAQPGLVVPGERPGVLNPDIPVTDDPAISIDDALTDAIDITDPVPGILDDFSGFGVSLKDKFPFCIPWDIYYLLSRLSETPKTPVFKLPLYLPRYGIREDIVVDMSPFESISRLSRAFLSLLFAFGLIKMTVSFIGMIDDNVTT